jgi:hypothetical protein
MGLGVNSVILLQQLVAREPLEQDGVPVEELANGTYRSGLVPLFRACVVRLLRAA